MSVPLATGRFTVRRPGAAVPAGPYDGHASYRGGADVRATDGRRAQVGAYTLLLDPAAWPVTEACLVADAGGRLFRVHSAELRDALPTLAHVTVDADRTTADATSDGMVDADGNVLEVPA